MITRWQEGDSQLINYRNENSWDCRDDRDRADNLARNGIAFSIWEGSARADTLLMILGMNFLWDGCAQVWALPSHEARGHARYMVESARVLMDVVAKKYRIHRYHTLIHPNLYENIKWIKLLGFQPESVLRSASPTKDNLIMYAKLYLEGYHEQTKDRRARLETDVAKLLSMDH